MTMKNTGSCLCGGVEFEAPKDLGDVRLCYCQSCRKSNGSAFSAVALIDTSDFRLVKGEALLATYESSPGKFRYFCSNCHSPLFVKVASIPDQVRIRLGLLNFEPKVNIVGHVYVKEKPGWYQITDALPQFQEF